MAKIAVVVLSGNDDLGRANAGLYVAKRMHDARQENGIDSVEVFLFAQGLRFVGERDSDAGGLIAERVAAGISAGGCANQLNNWGLAEAAKAMGVRAEFARDGYTVLTF